MDTVHDNLPEADGSENQPKDENLENPTPEAIEDISSEEKPAEVEPPKEEEPNATSAEIEEVAEKSADPEIESTAVSDGVEPQISDEELEQEDDTEEVESDEHDEEHIVEEELPLPDYSEYAPEKLVDEADKLLKNEPIQRIKEHFESIRKSLLKQLNDERQAKLDDFIEGGGVAMDFEYLQPLREKFRSHFSEYRKRRKKYYDNLRESLESNLKVKEGLIEKIKEIVTKDESIGETFKEFNALQEEWRNTGPVPRTNSNDLWRTYHHHVENFYEYIKINKELRDLDFKKNKDAKLDLIKQAEVLSEETDIRKAFKELQNLHKKWKVIGPIERENREEVWQQFSAATKKLHEKREEYYQKLNEERDELIEKKRALLEQIKTFPTEKIKNHHQWQEAMKGVEALREEFRRIGRINHPENDIIWEEFRNELRQFNHHKNEFYKGLKKQHQDNLAKKRALLEEAEKLKESDDWQYATNEMKRIQAQWKKVGHVPRSESDKIWKQFRAACNHYFDRLTKKNKEKDAQLEVNFVAKEELLKKLEGLKPSDNQKDSVKAIKSLINQWKDIGNVPRDKGKIENNFNKLLDAKFKAIDLDRKESQRIRFENKMESLAGQGNQELKRERSHLYSKMDEAKKDLNQLETNMNFFSSSSSNNPLLKEAQKSIDAQKRTITDIEQKIKMLNIKIREMEKAEQATAGDGEVNPEESSGE